MTARRQVSSTYLLAVAVALLAVCGGARLLTTADARAAAAPVTVAFTEVGAHPFTVPAGVTSIHVVAVGAPGGDGKFQKGGRGAIATADLAVSPGQVLNAFVGGPGANASTTAKRPGGFNGGGSAATPSAGSGGGASDLRTGSGAEDFQTRLVVGGGGGGGGAGSEAAKSTPGGDAGQGGAAIATRCTGGGPGTATEGGKGGTNSGEFSLKGQPGSVGVGGAASDGGGGGLFGGGAGGTGTTGEEGEIYGCGAGGGSSGFGPGATATSVTVSESRTPSVTITYVGPASSEPPSGGGKNPGGGGGTSTKTTLSLPATQHGKAVVGTVRIAANRSAFKAKLLWKKPGKPKKLVFGSLTEAPVKKGLHAFTVKLNGKGAGKLAALGKLKLLLLVKVTPPTGAAATAAKKVTLKP